jgi:hypothetical protein
MEPTDQGWMVHVAPIEAHGVQGVMGLVDTQSEGRRRYQAKEGEKQDHPRQAPVSPAQRQADHGVVSPPGEVHVHKRFRSANSTEPIRLARKRYCLYRPRLERSTERGCCLLPISRCLW